MKTSRAKLLLASVFIARGTSFLFSKTLLKTMPSMSILAVRFLLAFLILAVVFHKKLRACSKESLTGGVVLGTLYAVLMFCEMTGLKTLDTAVCSVIENSAIVLVPLLAAAITRTRPKRKALKCAILAFFGVACLSLNNFRVGGGSGLVWTFTATVLYAFCILYTARAAANGDPVTVGVIQMGTMGVLSLIAALLTGTVALPHGGSEWAMLLCLVLLCSCFGFTFQPLAQKYVSAETAAVFTVMNPLTAGVLGVLVAREAVTPLKALGCVIILTALFLYNRGGTEETA